jgi:hypothetical protein
VNFILGGRAEDYNNTGKTDTAELTAFKQFRFFSNASAQYNFNNSIYFNMNYNKDNATKYISIESKQHQLSKSKH